jgi:hypothetical protein
MRQSLKIALSLLVSILVFGAVAVAAFSGLFRVVETAFFQPRVLRFHQERLADIAAKVEQYHRGNLERFAPALAQPFVATAYNANSSQEDNFNRENYFGRLLEEYPGLQAVRLLGPEGNTLHFSTSRADYDLQANRRVYRRPDKLDDPVDPVFLAKKVEDGPRLVLDGSRGRFVYSFPVAAGEAGFRGSALFYVSQGDLLQYLLRSPSLDIRELLVVDRVGILVNLANAPQRLLSDAVVQAVSPYLGPDTPEGTLSHPLVIRTASGGEESYDLLTARIRPFGSVSLLVPFSAFELEPIMKAILLASVFLTVFLVVFLVFNLKQDPFLVLSQRIKRLQLGILQEFIEGRQRVDWQRWRDELVASRSVLSSRIKKGVGRLSGEREAELDALIERSWDEIIGIIEARVGSRREAVDISQVEQLIQRALDRGQISLQATVQPVGKVGARPAGLVVEEIGVEEVVEPGQVEAAEEAAEADEVAEVEQIEAAEEVEAAEEPAEVEELAELEEVGAAEEPGEAEELAEVEEVGAAEEPAEVEELAEVEEVGAAEAVPAEEPLEELEAVKALVPLPALPQEELEELPEAGEEPARAAKQVAVGREAVEELETAEELSPVEALLASEQELEIEELPGGRPSRRLTAEEIDRLQRADEDSQLDSLEKAGIIQSFTLAEFERMILEQRTSVVLEGGVYQIKEEVIGGRSSRGKGRGLKAIAEAVLSTEGKEEPEGAPGAGGGERRVAVEPGIGSLLGEELLIDLAGELGGDRESRGEEIAVGVAKVRKIRFFGNGLDYDGYLEAFRRGRTETDRLRSLVELSRKLKAVNAAIFVAVKDRFEPRLKVGLLDHGGALEFTAEEPVGARYLSARKTVVVAESLEKVKALSRHFHPDDLKYMQGGLFLPVIYQRTDGVLFLGLPLKKKWKVAEIISSLNIY